MKPNDSNEVVFSIFFLGQIVIELVIGELCLESSDIIVNLNDGMLKNQSSQS